MHASREMVRLPRSMIAELHKVILPLALDILTQTSALALRHDIYQADALRIATCKTSASNLFLSADKKPLKVAKEERLEALDIERDEEQITPRLH